MYLLADHKICRQIQRNSNVFILLPKQYSYALHRRTRPCWHMSFTGEYKTCRKHRETLLNPLANKVVLVHPSPLYSTHLAPVPTCRIHKSKKKSEKQSFAAYDVLVHPSPLYFSFSRSCSRAPITAVLDKTYTCTFLQTPQFAKK
jgi:hypothetical protein